MALGPIIQEPDDRAYVAITAGVYSGALADYRTRTMWRRRQIWGLAGRYAVIAVGAAVMGLLTFRLCADAGMVNWACYLLAFIAIVVSGICLTLR